jgi:glyoxylate utilization-related uncharacterized protein
MDWLQCFCDVSAVGFADSVSDSPMMLEGVVEITIGGKTHRLKGGDLTFMSGQQPHGLKALQRYKMILIMIRS